MRYYDRVLRCNKCNKKVLFTEERQRRLDSKHISFVPRFCDECRDKIKQEIEREAQKAEKQKAKRPESHVSKPKAQRYYAVQKNITDLLNWMQGENDGYQVVYWFVAQCRTQGVTKVFTYNLTTILEDCHELTVSPPCHGYTGQTAWVLPGGSESAQYPGTQGMFRSAKAAAKAADDHFKKCCNEGKPKPDHGKYGGGSSWE